MGTESLLAIIKFLRNILMLGVTIFPFLNGINNLLVGSWRHGSICGFRHFIIYFNGEFKSCGKLMCLWETAEYFVLHFMVGHVPLEWREFGKCADILYEEAECMRSENQSNGHTPFLGATRTWNQSLLYLIILTSAGDTLPKFMNLWQGLRTPEGSGYKMTKFWTKIILTKNAGNMVGQISWFLDSICSFF